MTGAGVKMPVCLCSTRIEKKTRSMPRRRQGATMVRPGFLSYPSASVFRGVSRARGVFRGTWVFSSGSLSRIET